MSQGLRDMLANRRFAIVLISLLAFCFIGLIILGVVLIWRPGASDDGGAVAQETLTPSVTPEPSESPTPRPTSTYTPTPRPSPTLVPVGTSPGTGGDATTTVELTATDDVSGDGGEATATSMPEATATSGTAAGAEDTPAPPGGEEELAQTGVGWGLILFSGIGLALLAVAARRLRLASR
jgi:hypothetical protein